MINEDQHSRRHEYIGGSDVPIILGRSKFKTPWELLLEKCLIVKNDFGGNIYSHVGTVLEPRIQSGLNIKNVDEINYIKQYNDVLFECHIDGIDKNEDLFYEIKVANQTMEECYYSYEWQIRTYMYATGYKVAKLILLNRNTCDEGKLRSCINSALRAYDIDFIHDFNKIDEQSKNNLLKDVNNGIERLNLYKRSFLQKVVEYDKEKEEYMLNKVELFWKFKLELDDNNNLINDMEFKDKFLKEFK